jgi:hypothetical protein
MRLATLRVPLWFLKARTYIVAETHLHTPTRPHPRAPPLSPDGTPTIYVLLIWTNDEVNIRLGQHASMELVSVGLLGGLCKIFFSKFRVFAFGQ